MRKSVTKIVKATVAFAMAIGAFVGANLTSGGNATRLVADNDILISENTTGTSYAGTNFTVSAGGATNSGYYKLGSSTLTSKNSYDIDGSKTISYSITTRKFGGPSDSEAVVNLSLLNGSTTVATASYSPTNTTLTPYTGSFTVTGDTSSAKFVIKGNGTSGGGKGVGISAISFTATSTSGGAPATYTITYHNTNSTGGSVPTDNAEYSSGDTATVADNTGSLVRTGYVWAGWSLNEDGSGKEYGPAYTSAYTMPAEDVDFYPVWKNPLPSSGTISITGSNPTIGSYGNDVSYTVKEDNTAGSSFAFKCTQVMKNGDNLQFKASAGILYSTTPLQYIRSVVVSGANSGDATITYGKSPNGGCTSNSIGLDNTYFKVANAVSGAKYWQITITYSPEEPDSLTGLEIASGLESVKKTYDDGETFDPTGLVIHAEWNNTMDTAHNVLNDVVWTPSPLVAGTTEVTGTFTHATGTETVTVTGLTVAAPDFVLDGNSNTPAGVGDDTSVTTGGEGKVNSSGVTYQYNALAVNDYNSSRNLEFNKDVSGAYIGNKDSYGKFIRRIKLALTSENFDKFTMYKGDSSIPETVAISSSGTGRVRFYNFNDDSEFFKLKLTTTGTWVNISKIEIFLGSNIPVVNSVSASIKSGTYYAGSTLSASDFNITASWTGGKADTHPVSGYTWTVNGVDNGSLNEGNNSVVVTYEGVPSSAFNVVGSPAAAKDVIESTLCTTTNLTYHYNALENTETDELDNGFIGVSGSSYGDWSDLSDNSSAVYSGNSSGGSTQDPKIQLRSKSESGIVTTTSGGKIKSITVVWNESSGESCILDVYGKNEAYSASSNLYNNSLKGTKLGSIQCGTSTTLAVSGDYSYIGLRSPDGAIYLDSISIEWATGGYSYTFSNTAVKFGGSISSALWDRLDSESNGILGYGVMLATSQYLDGDAIEDYYNAARSGKTDVDSVFTEVDGKIYTLVDGLSIKCFYNEVSTMPRSVNGNYVWDLVKGVNNDNAGLTKGYTAVAFIRTVDDEIIFLQETTKSAAQVAKDIINADPDDEYNNDYLNGSLGYLAGLAA